MAPALALGTLRNSQRLPGTVLIGEVALRTLEEGEMRVSALTGHSPAELSKICQRNIKASKYLTLGSRPAAVRLVAESAEIEKGSDLDWQHLFEADVIVFCGPTIANRFDQSWCRLRSRLFDVGYLPMKYQISELPGPHILYAQSSLFDDPSLAHAPGPHSVSMTCLGSLGRFGNQLWQYLFIRMYGLRNGLNVKLPEWEGERVFGLSAPRPSREDGQRILHFFGADDDDLELWEIDDAPKDVDFRGFFQQVPPQWRPHRNFIRKIFTLRTGWRDAVERLNATLRNEGRTLVTLHVRRGDYRETAHSSNPMFRMAPIEWYHALLEKVWPTLTRPLLHVSTDEPEGIRPEFEGYEKLDSEYFVRDFGIPDYVRDFVLLQQSDHLVACNSSFSTMAAVVGKPDQRCYLVDFNAAEFGPYDPWAEPSFGARFVSESRSLISTGYGLRGARKRALMMRAELGRQRALESEIERLLARMRYLDGGEGASAMRYLRRVWRAARGR